MKEGWNELSFKDKVAIISAIAAFCVGWGLTIAGFILGAGVVSDSVLWILGQALVYAGSIFGVGMYVGSEVKNMKKSIKNFMKSDEDEE